MAQKLVVKGQVVDTFPTRALAIVACFNRNLVFDRHSRRRNQLLPWVKIVGHDEEGDYVPTLPAHPED